jgi:predicted ArsR family transcriptional regulator
VKTPRDVTGRPVPAGTAADDATAGTRDRVARAILERGPATAAALAEQLAITPAAVRRHLDALVAEGMLEARVPRAYAPRGRGRPAKVFVLTDSGRDAFFQAYDDLAVSALRFLADRGGEDLVADFARRRVAELEDRYRPMVDKAGPAGAVQALADALTADGYAASAEASPVSAGEQLCQHHCPVAHVAEQFPQLCEAETQVFARLLGTHVQRLATIAHGDGVCTTHVSGSPAAATSTARTSTTPKPDTSGPHREMTSR